MKKKYRRRRRCRRTLSGPFGARHGSILLLLLLLLLLLCLLRYLLMKSKNKTNKRNVTFRYYLFQLFLCNAAFSPKDERNDYYNRVQYIDERRLI
jgi:hypothetical protein